MGSRSDVHIVTTTSYSDTASVAALHASASEHAPECTFHVIAREPGLTVPEGVSELRADDIRIGDVTIEELRVAMDGDALDALALMATTSHLLQVTEAPVLYLSPRAQLVRPLRPALDELLASGTHAAVARRRRAMPPFDGSRPDGGDVLDEGALATGILAAQPSAVPAMDALARALLVSWRRGGRPGVRSAFEHLALESDAVHVVDAPWYVDAWNIDERDSATTIVVDFGWPRPERAPTPLDTPGPARRPASSDPELTARLRARPPEPARESAPTVEVVPGVAYDATMRRRYARALRDWMADGDDRPPCPTRDGAAFLAWIAAPEHDGPVPVSRYLAELRHLRPDLQDAFPAVPGRSARGLVDWAIDDGAAEVPIPAPLVPPRPAPVAAPAYMQPGVNLAGFLTAELGVGEVARRLAGSMDAGSVPYAAYTFDRTSSRRALAAPDRGDLRFDTNIVCVNADSSGSFHQTVGPEFSVGRHRIGVWFWETSELPPMFHSAFGDVDEVWAASDFVAEALRASAPPDVQIVRFSLPIIAPQTDDSVTRASLDLPDDRFLFLFSFDHLSVAERKNPVGLVEAFRSAFAPGEGPVLVIKSINGNQRPDAVERLARVAVGREDIILRDGYLPATANAQLLALADCVVSLHRSEGFGFNLADAMALGTPVIATGWSGNLAFMSAEDCVLVPAGLVPVGDGNFPYLATSRWADPDLDVAAAAMRDAVQHPAAGRVRAAAARERVLRDFSPEATGRFVRDRIATIRAARSGSNTGGDASPTDAVRRIVKRLGRRTRPLG
jgi:glycosyltransferase involved in cell wall biosynthesis